MLSYLVAYVCTTAVMDDCQVYVPDTWEGPNAAALCQEAKAPKLAQLQADYRRFFVRVECESQPAGE